MNNLNVIIADDHPIVLFGIRKSLEQIEWVNVVGEFEDSTALINNLSKLDANVLITDLSMPGEKYGDGITLIKYIKRHYPDLSIIVLTMNNNPAILSSVLDLDIEGIVLKQGAPTDLPKALAALQKGKKYTPESVAKLLEKISAGGYGDKRLSPKESEVLRLFAEGFLVTEIAKKLNRSIKTISSQKKSAMMKLGVDNDIALLNYLSSVSQTQVEKDEYHEAVPAAPPLLLPSALSCPRFTYPLRIDRQRYLQHIQRHRLRQTVIHACIHTTLLLFSQRIRGNANHREQMSQLTKPLRQSVTIHVRHIDVGQHDINLIAAQNVERIDAILRRFDLIPQRTELF